MVKSGSTEGPAAIDPPELIDALVQTSLMTMAVLNKIGAAHDLSLTQLRVLGILRDRRLKMTELADYLGLDKSTMTGLVSRAESRRLLKRAPNRSDGRAVDVLLTAEGAKLVARLYAQVEGSLSAMTGTLTRTEQRRLQSLLERVLDRS